MSATKPRAAERRRILKRARIVFKGRFATIDCIVRSVSDNGACLTAPSVVGIPDAFDLVLDRPPARACRVVWRKAAQIGVQFV